MAKHEKEIPLDGSLSGVQSTQLADGPRNEDERDVSTADRIRMRAYELYLERGTEPDNPMDDWLQAEAEFRRTPDEVTRDSHAPRGGLLAGGPPNAGL
ncbi:MAG TPA: DUF2934 domain-containing protein [Gemmatimonadaceae bacterium]|nr:DUF2934 domain-containing protein [Gemmatimonadaceae bacterium]